MDRFVESFPEFKLRSYMEARQAYQNWLVDQEKEKKAEAEQNEAGGGKAEEEGDVDMKEAPPAQGEKREGQTPKPRQVRIKKAGQPDEEDPIDSTETQEMNDLEGMLVSTQDVQRQVAETQLGSEELLPNPAPEGKAGGAQASQAQG